MMVIEQGAVVLKEDLQKAGLHTVITVEHRSLLSKTGQ
jgi:hypothetical protein